MNKLKDLRVWQKSIELGVEVYKITSKFPAEERYGLTGQIRRAAISISSNIAEGAGRNTTKEFNNFLGIANGPAFELQSQLIIASRLELIDDEYLEEMLSKINYIQKMCFLLQRNLNKA